ncbi:uncharacterized protein RAG0_08684 [Rhynchosporium agropyri]|uniref:Uncharacterized protein n=1 Tax=Rhynchosporium agropyri TaxID=914238 RepID=A0A1E1KRZ4_9HELO|nr:uncharacterized protein RAG0_08684 [Rhynchosporium agropyri]
MQHPLLDPEKLHFMTLADARTRLYTKASPGHPNGKGLFGGLPSPPPRKRLPRSSPVLRPGLTPWLYDWVSDKNDLLPKDGFDFWGDDLPDDEFSLGPPVDRINYWEKPWIQARVLEHLQEVTNKGKQALKKTQKKRSIPLSRVGRKKAWKKQAEGKPKRKNGKFFKEEKVIIIGED